MSVLQVGDVIRGYYVTGDSRYYKVMKITPMKVKVLRLKHRFDAEGRDIGPGHTTYGKEHVMTKKGELSAMHYGMECTRL